MHPQWIALCSVPVGYMLFEGGFFDKTETFSLIVYSEIMIPISFDKA